jgi:hypothetical protein
MKHTRLTWLMLQILNVACISPYILRYFRWQDNFDKPVGRQSCAARGATRSPETGVIRGMGGKGRR